MRVVRSLTFAASLVATGLAASGPGLGVRVTPPVGSANTTFTVSFRVPQSTGSHSGVRRYDQLTGSTAAGGGCIATFSVRAPDAGAGTRVAVTLDPRLLGGSWCRGTYAGRIDELQSPICSAGHACPMYVLLRPLGRFSLRID